MKPPWRRLLWGTPLKPTRLLKRIHARHLRWNESPSNRDYDPWISSCSCCCLACEKLQGTD